MAGFVIVVAVVFGAGGALFGFWARNELDRVHQWRKISMAPSGVPLLIAPTAVQSPQGASKRTVVIEHARIAMRTRGTGRWTACGDGQTLNVTDDFCYQAFADFSLVDMAPSGRGLGVGFPSPVRTPSPPRP